MIDLQFVTESSIRGYHVYKSLQCPEIGGGTLSTKKEHNNPHDRFAVAVLKGKLTLGHIQKKFKDMLFFLHKARTIRCTAKDKTRRSSIKQGGLEVSFELTFSIPNVTIDNETIMSKLRKLLA